MTLGVTGVVWLPRTATVNSGALLLGTGPAPLIGAAGAWGSVAAAYTDASITVGRVMAVLAAGWEGEAANAAQARFGGFLAWTQGAAALATEISGHAFAEAAAYTTAVAAMPNPVEIAAVKSAKVAAYSSGGALNGSAEALEVADSVLDVRAALVMDGYEAATTPLAITVSFDRPPEIVNDTSGDPSGPDGTIAGGTSYEETTAFGFSAHTSPAQAVIAAATAAVQNPALAAAAGQVAGSAGSIAGSSVTTVASAATNVGGSAVSTFMNSQNFSQGSAGSPLVAASRADAGTPGSAATRAMSFGSIGSTGSAGPGVVGFGRGSGGLGSTAFGAPNGPGGRVTDGR
ncbi:PPE domain-containing protein [Rhodococcus sp. 1168]|uniref:PPE domain-containing protein n=1 Tax=Rhodococcus sp. 1168 TaxID=2018041 RepID=UPI0020CB208B|nr:PPE domain-containing protein [Rhodococcus sp. 1168]